MNVPIIQGNEVVWEDLNITVHFNKELDEYAKSEFKNVVAGWYSLGIYGAFDGVLHNMSEIWVEDTVAGFTVDMGSIEATALEYLFRAIEGLAAVSEIGVERIVIGSEAES